MTKARRLYYNIINLNINSKSMLLGIQDLIKRKERLFYLNGCRSLWVELMIKYNCKGETL